MKSEKRLSLLEAYFSKSHSYQYVSKLLWQIEYCIFMETAILVYNLVQRLHLFKERNRCMLTFFLL